MNHSHNHNNQNKTNATAISSAAARRPMDIVIITATACLDQPREQLMQEPDELAPLVIFVTAAAQTCV